MPDTAPVSLHVRCCRCRGPVILQMAVWPTNWIRQDTGEFVPIPELSIQTWACPHCHGSNQAGFLGQLAWISRGQQEPAPNLLAV